jgi:hypothetical protein
MRRRNVLWPVVLLLLFAGCRDAKITSYRVPKEAPEPLPPILTGEAPAATDMAATAVTTASGDGLRWQAPETWKAKPASAMRKGSYAVGNGEGATADLSITAFPGDVGGTLANVNRWRGQIELPPLQQAELAGAITSWEANGLHLNVVEFANPQATKPQRILGAIIAYEGATWFFKLMGPDAVVTQEKPTFMTFLQTIKAPNAATR